MTNKKQDFEDTLILSKVTLGLSGIHIYPKIREHTVVSFIKTWLYFFNISWLYPDLFGEFYWVVDGLRAGRSFDEVAMGVPCGAVCIMSTVKSWPLYSNLKIVLTIIDKLRTMHPEIKDGERSENFEDNELSNDDFQKKVAKDTVNFLNLVLKFLFYTWSIMLIMFSTLPFAYMLHEFLTTGKTERKLPYYVKYFYDPFTPGRWPFVYVHQVWSSYIACLSVFGADTLLFALITYIHMHFRILCHELENVVSDDIMETKANFRKAVKKHQDLIKLVEQTELLYTKSTLCNIMSSSLLICLSLFIITFVDDIGTVLSFVAFFIMSLSQIFLLCYFGEMLMTSSVQVAEAIYNCKWYQADPDIKRCVLLVMIRAQRPCKLTAMNYADVNLNAFTTILSRSWSYFALLKTIMDD